MQIAELIYRVYPFLWMMQAIQRSSSQYLAVMDRAKIPSVKP